MKEQQAAQNSAEHTRIRYLPLGRAMPDMVLGKALVIVEHGKMTYSLPEGHVLNLANLEQLRAHHAEVICIVESDTRTEEERAAGLAATEKTLERVFALADPDNLLIKNLRHAVLEYRRQ